MVRQFAGVRLHAWVLFLCCGSWIWVRSTGVTWAAEACSGFTVRDMIDVARFKPISSSWLTLGRKRVLSSPDGRYFMAVTEYGDLASNHVIDEILVWDTRSLRKWLKGNSRRPAPFVEIRRRSTGEYFGVGYPADGIRHIRWSSRSDQILFLSRSDDSSRFGLYEASLDGRVKRLSSRGQSVRFYSQRSGVILYESGVTNSMVRRVAARQDAKAYFVGSGHTLRGLLDPIGETVYEDRVQLWRISGTGARPVRVPVWSKHWSVRDMVRHVLSISPGHQFAVMDLPVKYVPAQWVHYGNPGVNAPPVWPHVGAVADSDNELWVPHEYVIVNLKTGTIGPATGAPDGMSQGFWSTIQKLSKVARPVGAVWAPDGNAVLLLNTFLPVHRLGVSGSDWKRGWGTSRPCIALMDVRDGRENCLENVTSHDPDGLETWSWQKGVSDRLLLTWRRGSSVRRTTYCVHPLAVKWIVQCGNALRPLEPKSTTRLRIRSVQSLNSPPELVAALPGMTVEKVLFDPNIKLRNRCMGDARLVHPRIGGASMSAILLLPQDYLRGQRYPLVLQTHGVLASRFVSSGLSAPFAARALASSGMAVMQLPVCGQLPARLQPRHRVFKYPDLIPCEARIYDAAIRYAVNKGIADPRRLGIVGFSETGENVLEALEHGPWRIAAAELEDSSLDTYTQFVNDVGERAGWDDAFETPSGVGAPFGSESAWDWWVHHSPGFRIYRIRSPLLIQANGRDGVMDMWEPYAVLHYLGKPVDLVVIHKGTHPLTNPREKLASEGLTVDWFKFWLEDRCPKRTEECRRWSRLRDADPSTDATRTQHRVDK